MSRRLTIVVGGYIVGYPLGGMTWHHLNYLLGLQSLGHEVWFFEDSPAYALPYNPTTWTCEADSTYGRNYLTRTFDQYRLPHRYCYYSEAEDRYYGLTRDELHELLRRADLMLCVSGVTPIRPERPRPRRLAVIDTDPVFTQLRMCHDGQFLDYYKQFDSVATFGRLIGTAECPLPTHGFEWIPTNQPVSLEHWPVREANPAAGLADAFTTIGKWEHTTDRHFEFKGRRYLSSKGVEWMKLLELPSRTPWKLTLGMASVPGATRTRFESHGWHWTDPEAASISCPAFAEFIANSAGELTVAKEIYAGLPSGWFSDRSAAYLASGRPVVTQSSGFERWLPTGEGLFAFKTIDEAADGLNAIQRDYVRHATAARGIAEKYFDARVVLSELLERVI